MINSKLFNPLLSSVRTALPVAFFIFSYCQNLLAGDIDLSYEFSVGTKLTCDQGPRPCRPWGHDLTALVTGNHQRKYRRREAVYAEAVDKRCLRTREWKLIHYPAKEYGELYHLAEDPYCNWRDN